MSKLRFMSIRGAPVLAAASGAASALDRGGGMHIGLLADGSLINTGVSTARDSIVSGFKRVRATVGHVALTMAKTTI